MSLFDALGITYETNKDIGRTSYERGEDIRLNPWQRFLGATDEDAENARLKAQQRDLQSRYGSSLAQVGSTGVDWGETEQEVMGKIARLTEERQGGQDNKRLSQQLKIVEKQQEPGKATNSRLLEGQRQSHNLALMQMRDASEARLAELAYMRMRDRKADMQYNERMEKLDRKDRILALQNITAGLASLGAAFAV